ncbi:hypothetical protein [Methylobacter svalbardensis]|uniref:hypothetical protein n=1 Tax=Methylobacter svalbardensis TaxID=3080016 RepID=UPI0030EB87A8
MPTPWRTHGATKNCAACVARLEDKTVRIETATAWEGWLDQHKIKAKRHRRIITAGAWLYQKS